MSSIKKNYMYNVFYQMLIIILPLITAPYISRVVGAERLGIYSYSYSITHYFVLFTLLGVNNYGNRSIAQVRDNREKMQQKFWEIYFLQLILGLMMSLLFFAYIVVFCEENKGIFFIQYLYLFSAILDINWFFFGIEKFKLTVARNTVIKILTVLLIFIFVKNKNDLWKYTLIMSAGTLLSQLILFLYLFKIINFEKIKIREIKKHLKPNLLLFIPVLATSIYTIMDKIMIGQISSMMEVGLYEYAEKLKNIPLGVITALGVVMLPQISNMIANGKKIEAIENTYKSLIFALFISFALVFGMAGISKEFVPTFYGEDFNGCILIINILVISIIFIALANVIRTQILIPYNKNKEYIISTMIGAIVNVLLNLILIIKFNAIGAAIATLISEILVALYQAYSVREILPLKRITKYLVIFGVSGAIMYSVVRVIGNIHGIKITTVFFEIFVGCIVYTVTCLLFLSLKKGLNTKIGS